MVEITNGKKIFSVPAGSVAVYKGMGFRVVKKGSESVSTPEEKEPVQTGEEEENVTDIPGFNDGDADDGEEGNNGSDTDVSDEERYVNELLEKPISQWSSDEVKNFVRIKGIDTSGAEKLSHVRSIIKAHLEEQHKNS